MRSELVFRARETVANSYLLCQATAKTTRSLYFASADTTGAITDAFVRIAEIPSLSSLTSSIGHEANSPD